MRGWIRGNWRHLMVGLLCTAIVISSTALYLTYRQPEVCSLCGSGKRERYQAPAIPGGAIPAPTPVPYIFQ